MGINFASVDWETKLTAPAVGIDVKFLKKAAGPCPLCGGKDRFRFDNKGGLGTWWCQGCGPGNGYTLLMKVTGWGAAEALKYLDDGTPTDVEKPVRVFSFQDSDFSPEKVASNRKKLTAAWSRAQPLNGRDPASLYLKMRVPGCDIAKLSGALRYHRGMGFWERAENSAASVCRGTFPTLLARAVDASRTSITCHRTYLTVSGVKAPFENVKKQMKGVRKLDGAAVHVVDVPESRTLGITEGIENAVAVATGYRYTINVWALLNCGNLALADIPAGRFDRIIIFADHDPIDPQHGHRPGEHHAMILKDRLEKQGYEVVLKIPPVEGTDFADVWCEYVRTKAEKESTGVSDSAPKFKRPPERAVDASQLAA